MTIHPEQLARAEKIDAFTNQFSNDEAGDTGLLSNIYDYMDTFKEIMDNGQQGDMDYLCARYDGFYRFAKLLEAMAQAISDGTIDVPKDH